MHCLFSFSILVEPDIQRLSGLLLEALRRLDAPVFASATRIPALNQHLREALCHAKDALDVRLILEGKKLSLRWSSETFPLASVTRSEPFLLEQIHKELQDQIRTQNPELLRLQNESIRQKLTRAQRDAQEEIRNIEHQLIHRKKELDLYIKKAETDSLTGILNRGAYDRILHETLRELARNPKPFSLIFLDLDYFKEVNDTFGHGYGDEVLRSMAMAMRATIREGQDKACRIGGDEFAILLGADMQQAERISKIILSDMDQKVSIGIAAHQEGDTPESLARKADQALYYAKENGRGQIALASLTETASDLHCHICR
ncbi:GGDEF domain-containing protein [Desulfobotulus sp.]|uniref:GGDEF domain-containing protein n=1 Tax=Desulfobotulus sp. TaxID=1940337 RepID=UPI002A35DD8D|nr:GGDEF domain-containing protein [Desulfobotulus sp.]MDY0163918.1 GGDEF domain-containing protein [Desulfobotulus sp.]